MCTERGRAVHVAFARTWIRSGTWRASAATRSPIRSSATGRSTSCSCTGGCARSSPRGSGRRWRRSTSAWPGMGRLILFDKRGTGLSDRVLGIASLEERMDDVRAVMDAAAVERAAVVGRVRGRADVRAVRGDASGSHARAGDDGVLRAAQLGAGLSDRAQAGAGHVAAADRGAVGRVRGAAVPGRAGAVDRGRSGGDRVVHVLPGPRGEPVGGGGDHGHERGDRRAAGAADRAGAGARPAPPSRSTCATRRGTWASGCPARRSSRCRGSTTCRGRATRRRCSTRSSCSSAAWARRRSCRAWS